MSVERANAFIFKGGPKTLVGPELKVGDQAPAFTAVANDLSTFDSASLAGKVRIFFAVPSLDTGTCDAQTRRFNQEAANLGDNIVIVTVSMDLPFAQKRWCGAAGIDKVLTVSDHVDAKFGVAYGTLMKEFRLESRAVFVVDSKDKLVYVEYMKVAGDDPTFDAVLAAAKAAK
jgi:thiol peroxidase